MSFQFSTTFKCWRSSKDEDGELVSIASNSPLSERTIEALSSALDDEFYAVELVASPY